MPSKKSFMQFIKYSLIGGLNVIIDFAILNLLWFSTACYEGRINYLFKFISFCAYSTNGYFMNKKFTFKSKESSYFKYISVIGIAALLNGIILSNLTIHNFLNLKSVLWANISALVASITTGIISFLINKFLVFKNN